MNTFEALVEDLIVLKKTVKQKEASAELLGHALEEDNAKLAACKEREAKLTLQQKTSLKKHPKPQKNVHVAALRTRDHLKLQGLSEMEVKRELVMLREQETRLDEEIKMLKTARARAAKQLHSFGECAAELSVVKALASKPKSLQQPQQQESMTRIEPSSSSSAETTAAAARAMEDVLNRLLEQEIPQSHKGNCCDLRGMESQFSIEFNLRAHAVALKEALTTVVQLYRTSSSEEKRLAKQVSALETALQASYDREMELKARLGEDDRENEEEESILQQSLGKTKDAGIIRPRLNLR